MKKNLLALTLVAGLMASASVFAADTVADPSFDYVQVLGQSRNLPVTNGYGVDVQASKTLGDTFFVAGEWDRANVNVATADEAKVGLGLRVPFLPGSNLYGEAFALHQNLNYKDWTYLKDRNSWGYGVQGGIRYNLTNQFEVRGGVETEKVNHDSQWTTYGVVGGQFNLTQNLAVVADAKIHSSTDRIYQAGVRLSF